MTRRSKDDLDATVLDIIERDLNAVISRHGPGSDKAFIKEQIKRFLPAKIIGFGLIVAGTSACFVSRFSEEGINPLFIIIPFCLGLPILWIVKFKQDNENMEAFITNYREMQKRRRCRRIAIGMTSMEILNASLKDLERVSHRFLIN